MQIGEIIQEQAMDEAVATSNAPEKNAGNSIVEECLSTPGEGMAACKQKTHDIVLEHCQASYRLQRGCLHVTSPLANRRLRLH